MLPRVSVGMPRHTGGGQRTSAHACPHIPPHLSQDLFAVPIAYTRRAHRNSPVSTSIPTVGVLRLQMWTIVSRFTWVGQALKLARQALCSLSHLHGSHRVSFVCLSGQACVIETMIPIWPSNAKPYIPVMPSHIIIKRSFAKGKGACRIQNIKLLV